MKKFLQIMALVLVVASIGVCISAGITTYRAEETPAAVQTLVLKQGSQGDEVKTMQKKLKNWGYYSGAVDGIFGSKTKEAVKYFQRKNGLTVDGIVGTNTLKALGMSGSSSSSGSSGSYSSSDLNLLARLIYAEARGESYTGQVAVGAVVLNRVESYQPYAFTCVQDGQFNLTPDATAKRAAQDALNGWDPSYGALYYYNPAVATSSWIFSRQTVVTIGKHVFAI